MKMSDFKQLHIQSLTKAIWSPPQWESVKSTIEQDWLQDVSSMTKRLKTHCETFNVQLLAIEPVPAEALSENEAILLGDGACLAREVVLLGNHIPWVCARTLIPMTTLTEQEKDLAELGKVPLGERLFADKSTYRDEIQLAHIDIEGKSLLARRSRLWINNKPMLVAELFLPDAPIYHEEKA